MAVHWTNSDSALLPWHRFNVASPILLYASASTPYSCSHNISVCKGYVAPSLRHWSSASFVLSSRFVIFTQLTGYSFADPSLPCVLWVLWAWWVTSMPAVIYNLKAGLCTCLHLLFIRKITLFVFLRNSCESDMAPVSILFKKSSESTVMSTYVKWALSKRHIHRRNRY